MDDAACRAQHGMTMQMERTTRIHWQMKLLCLVSCVFPSYFVFHGLINCEYISDEEFQSTGTTRSSMKDDAANGAHQGLVCSDGRPSTPRISTARLRSFRKVSNFKLYFILDYFLLHYVSGHDSIVFFCILIVWLPFYGSIYPRLHVFAIDMHNWCRYVHYIVLN